MIHVSTTVKTADNSGVNTAKCIKNLGGSNKKYSKLGDIIKLSVKKLKSKLDRSKQKVKKSDLLKGLVVSTKVNSRRLDGSYIKFNSNRIVVLNNNTELLGNRIISPICKEIRGGWKEKKYKQIISLSKTTL